MRLGGLQKFTLIDYPAKAAAVIFTIGCNFRCPYCHNPELVLPEKYTHPISVKEVLKFLEKRRGQLDAVVITGGEPTLQKDLVKFIGRVKKMGFLIKLDTNGRSPEIIKELLKKKLVDYLAMDIKAPLKKYSEVACMPVEEKKIKESIKFIMKSGIDYEFRTTVVKEQLTPEDLLEIGKLVKGARLYALQKFVPSKTNNPHFLKATTYSDREFEKIRKKLGKLVNACLVR